MCGRTCLTLDQNKIICACKYRPKTNSTNDGQKKMKQFEKGKISNEQEFIMPTWRAEYNFGRCFAPSYNIAPTEIVPVLVSGQHFSNAVDEKSKRVIVPMMWGMIPFWHRGDYRKHGLSTNNCRLENMLESKLFRGPFQRGQRCVVLCEGFYEWETTKSVKPSQRAAYFLFAPQTDGVRIHDKSSWTPDNVRLLKLAGLYDIWENDDGDKIYSFSVITFESSKIMSWLHHRMPAILETENQIDDWLDYERVSQKEALNLLRPATQLIWHRVANVVNNSRNKAQECNKPFELVKDVPRNKIMNAWLNSSKRRKESEVSKNSSVAQDNDKNIPIRSEEDKKSNESENPAKRVRLNDV